MVTEIANAASATGQNMDQVTKFPVKIRILQSSYEKLAKRNEIPDPPFRPDMSATVDIRTETVRDAISVPIRAVTTRQDTAGNKNELNRTAECVFIHKNGKALKKTVKTGIQNDSHIHIKKGVKPGQEVITAPYDVVSRKLKDSANVSVVENRMVFQKKDQ